MLFRVFRRMVLGAVAGYVANRAMDVATAWWYARQSDESKAQEERVFPGGAIVAAGHDVATLLHVDADDEQTLRLGVRAHRAMGMSYGVIAALLVGFGVRPMRAGLLTGAAAFVLVDEALNAVQLEPSPSDFPVEAHLRGVIGHACFGAVLGVLLTVARPLLSRRT
jgi:hypothetical protein